MIRRSICVHALVAACMLLVLFAALSASDEGVDNTENDKRKIEETSSAIPSWSAYMRFFNKKYSSLSQQLLRQKLFIARAIEVFLTRIKYRLSQLSYFAAINEYSDATQDEAKRMLSGDQSDDDINEEPPMSDEEAEKLLLETLKDNIANGVVTDPEEGNEISVSRKRRSPDGEPSSSEAPLTKIRWRVPSDNPDYEPIQVGEDGVREKKVADDIPAERAAEIEINADQSSNKLGALVGGGLGKMKSAIGGAIDWLTPGGGQTVNGGEQSDLLPPDAAVTDNDENDAPAETIVLVDWLKSGCMGPVRNQGDCLSCYAISAMGYMEWALCRNQNNQVTPLSVQYMVSCGPQYKQETRGKVKLDGCSRGTSRQTVDFIREYGLELEANMPYMEDDTPCPIRPNTPRKKKGYIRPNARPAIRLKYSTNQLNLALKTGPVIVGMWEPMNFLSYGGGMIERCYPEGGHAMLIVGAMVENGEEYLLIKNSFGTSWGYDGYFKFKRSSVGECVKEFIVPRVSFASKKSQARRIKAYLSEQQIADNDSDGHADTYLDASILDN